MPDEETPSPHAFEFLDLLSSRTRRLLMTYSIGMSTARLIEQWWRRARDSNAYTIVVPGNDELYADLHAWLIDNIPADRRRSLTVKSPPRGEPVPAGHDNGQAARAGLRLFHDGRRAQTIVIEGHPIRIEIERPDISLWKDEEAPHWALGMERINFTARDAGARDAILRLLTKLAEKQRERLPRLRVANRYGGWTGRGAGPTRSLQSVVLRKGQKERLTHDLERFLAAESDYARLGVPWHRGLIFHGPPGCGKSSAAAALATHFGLDIYFIPLPVVQNDSVLIELLNNVEQRSMLLLEDIDIVKASHQREAGEEGVSLSGLLNALDGLVTPHGLITVMTTNDLKVLDPALLRPGRADLIEKFEMLDDEQFQRLLGTFLGERARIELGMYPISPAQVIEAIKQHIGDIPATLDEIRKAVRETQRTPA